MKILGISAFYHDSAACLIIDGKIVAAAQEERFSRKKHDASIPVLASEFCLKMGNISFDELDAIVFYDKPFLKFERILETYLQFAPKGFASFLKAIPMWIKKKLWIPELIHNEFGCKTPIYFCEHHESHSASAFYPSPFQNAAFLTLDGVGEWATASWGVGQGKTLKIKQEIHFPHSLGLLYSAFTYFTGFRVNSAEYKVMGLAPYGRPLYKDLILKHLIDLKEDGSFRINLKYFDYCAGLKMTHQRFATLFGIEPRKAESKIRQEDMDLAASIQVVTEEIVLKIAHYIHQQTGMDNLCLAGGVALNCVSNGRLLREGPFKNIWIQPAAGDAGGALGAALLFWHRYAEKERIVSTSGEDSMQGSLLGSEYSQSEIQQFLEGNNIPHTYYETPEKLTHAAAQVISDGDVVGWFQGRMEFGPRALGNRSILGDPRSESMQEKMNLKIKYRESFRPFAPAVLRERARDYFDLKAESPYMLIVAPVAQQVHKKVDESTASGLRKLYQIRSSIPAVTHVDYSARVQTVTDGPNPIFRKLIEKFDLLTGCPVLINTSFNVRGEPIVESPHDAYQCFMRTEMDCLVLGSFILHKKDQPLFPKDLNWQTQYELD